MPSWHTFALAKTTLSSTGSRPYSLTDSKILKYIEDRDMKAFAFLLEGRQTIEKTIRTKEGILLERKPRISKSVKVTSFHTNSKKGQLERPKSQDEIEGRYLVKAQKLVCCFYSCEFFEMSDYPDMPNSHIGHSQKKFCPVWEILRGFVEKLIFSVS